MHTRKQIKNEIDQIPDELIEKVYLFIDKIKKTKKETKRIHTYKLNGAFDRMDRMDIRKLAYE